MADFYRVEDQHNRHAKRNTNTRKKRYRRTNSQRTTGAHGAGGRRPASAARAADGGAGGALGINAKLRATFPDPMESRVQRFALQSMARAILPESRTAKCLRIRAHDCDVQVWKSREHGTASYGGLQTCGSVWTCPVCAAKIAERRRVELLDAMELHKAQGGAVYLLTLTTPHQRGDVLAELLDQQGKALQSFLRDRKVKEVFKEMGHIGQVRALEVTHGRKAARNNGWHPHFHILQFCQVNGSEADRKDWTARLYMRWAAYCQKAGLGMPSYAHGIKLDDGTKASDYVTKWGLEDEMTKGHTKKAKAGAKPRLTSCALPWRTARTNRPWPCFGSSRSASRANVSCPGRMA